MIYEYAVLDDVGNETGEIIEEFQSINDDPLTEIIDEKTGEITKVKRIISQTSTHFIGSGWTKKFYK